MKKIALSMVVFALFLGALWLLNLPKHSSFGTITVQVVDASGTFIIDAEHSFDEADTLFIIMNENYTIVCANALYRPDESCSVQPWGRVILSIDDVHTDWQNTFLHLTVNGEHSHLGVDSVPMKDNDVFRFTVKTPN